MISFYQCSYHIDKTNETITRISRYYLRLYFYNIYVSNLIPTLINFVPIQTGSGKYRAGPRNYFRSD